ncbi:TonB-dependent receptor [bacterium]|nr:TonB-dependent receptor [bacterium]
MKNMRKFFFPLVIILLPALIAGNIFAANTGKITGTVKDKKTGDPIIGANVIIENTSWGAMTDLDGFFSMINIPPSKYTVLVSYIGYIPIKQTDVIISIDQNTVVNFNLESTVLEAAEPVEIIYTKPTVQPDVVTSVKTITKEQTAVLPVNDISEVIAMQAGVKIDPEGKIHVRGGEHDQTLFIIQGLEMNDPLGTGRQTFNLPTEAVSEVQVMTGNYGAEYGNALAGVINQTLETGNPNKYAGKFSWQTDRLWDEYSFDTDRFDMNISGPLPFTKKFLGKTVTFAITGWGKLSNTYIPFNVDRGNTDVLNIGLDIPERQDNNYGYQTIFGYDVDPQKKLSLTIGGARSLWDIYPFGDAVGGNYGYQYKYNVENRPFIEKEENFMVLAFNSQLSANTVYDISIGRHYTHTLISPRNKTPGDFTMYNEVEDYLGSDRLSANFQDANGDGFPDGFFDANDNNIYDGESEGYEDLNMNGTWDRGEDWVDINGNGIYDFSEPWRDASDPITGANNVGQWDSWDPYTDLNGNGKWDASEPQLPEQDWNLNGVWDGERFIDANDNGMWDSNPDLDFHEGYDDYNVNGVCDPEMLFSNESEDNPEPFFDGDLWFDTGEPFYDVPRLDLTTGEYVYNSVWDEGEVWIDLPSSYTFYGFTLGEPTLNGQYDQPNGQFDEYELFTYFADLEYGMDPSQPVKYTWNPQNHGSEWRWTNYLAEMPQSTWIDRNGNGGFDPPNFTWDEGEWFEDYNGNGYWNGVDYFLNPGAWDASAFYQDRETTTYNLKFKIQSQLSKHHEVNAGAQFKYYETSMQSIQQPDLPYVSEIPLPSDSPYPDRGNSRDYYDYKPFEGGLFFSDKMEFEGLIINASMRWDFFIHDPKYINLTEQLTADNPYFTYQNSRGQQKLAPRLGISHPITRGSKLFFNYSHKYQHPSFDYFFKSQTSNLAAAPYVGNPDLEYQKTVEYELGVETEIGKFWVLRLAGYYKDNYNLVGSIPIVYGPLDFRLYSNTNYGRARGMEIKIDKTFSQNYLFSFTYDFSYALGKTSANYYDSMVRLADVTTNHDEYPLGWDERHVINMYTSVRYQHKEYPRLFGFRLPDNWLLTIQWAFGSGVPYTPSQYTTGMASELILPNSSRYPWTEKTSLKFEKYFKPFKNSALEPYFGIEVDNLFNKKNISELYAETGSPYYATHPDNPNYNPIGQRGDYDANPRNFDPGRNVSFRFGVRF